MANTLEWHGPQIQRRVRRASLTSVQSTIEAAAKKARKKHPGWQRRTGELQQSIQVLEPAHEIATGIRGSWGVRESAFHWLFLEFGTAHSPATPFLRPAARTSNKRLKFRVRHHFKAGG